MRRLVAAALVSVFVLGCAASADARMPMHWRTWVKIGRCEQPGPGKWGIYWRHPGPTYGGGLGIYQGTWQAFKPRVKGFPSTPGRATWREQMWVANRIYARYGTSAWGCG